MTPPDRAPSRERRDRLLRALVEPGPPAGLLGRLRTPAPARLLGYGERQAEVLLPDGEQALLVALPPRPEVLALLEQAIPQLVDQVAAGALHLVLVGGGPELVAALPGLAPPTSPTRRVTLHLVDDQGRYHAARRRLRPIALAAERARVAGAALAPLDDEEAATRQRRDALAVAEQRRFLDAVRARRPLATWAIAGALGVLFALELWWGAGSASRSLYAMGANHGRAVAQGEWWRLLASTWLHGNALHLGMNVVALVVLAPFFEGLLGRPRFLVLYLGSGLAGALASALCRPEQVSIGASGAIFGLLGAAAALVLRPRGLLPPLLLAQLRRGLRVPLAINLAVSLLPGIDLWAHLGGGAGGLLLLLGGAVTRGLPPVGQAGEERRAPRALYAAAALALLVASLASLTAAALRDRPWELRGRPTVTRMAVPGTPVTLELPRLLRARPGEEDSGDTLFGQLPRDPVMLEVHVSGAFSPAELSGFDPEELRAVVARSSAEAEARPGVRALPPRLEPLGANLQVTRTIDYDPRGLHRRDGLALVGDRLVSVHAYWSDDTPPAWREAALATLGSARNGERSALEAPR